MDTDTDADTDTPTERPDPYCLRPGEAEALLAGSPWRRLLVMGDSIAAGVGDPVDGFDDWSWADRLAGALADGGLAPAYRNLGVIDARAAEIRAGQLDAALAFAPDLAVVSAGGNDALRRSFPGRAGAVEADLERVVGALHARGALVVTFSHLDVGRTTFLPPERRAGLSERLDALGQLTERVTRRFGGVHVDLLRHPALSEPDRLFSADHLHPNRRGHAIVAAELIRSLARHREGLMVAVPLAS